MSSVTEQCIGCGGGAATVWSAGAEGNLLQEQAEAIKQVSEYVSQLRRVGKGLGVFEFDRCSRPSTAPTPLE